MTWGLSDSGTLEHCKRSGVGGPLRQGRCEGTVCWRPEITRATPYHLPQVSAESEGCDNSAGVCSMGISFSSYNDSAADTQYFVQHAFYNVTGTSSALALGLDSSEAVFENYTNTSYTPTLPSTLTGEYTANSTTLLLQLVADCFNATLYAPAQGTTKTGTANTTNTTSTDQDGDFDELFGLLALIAIPLAAVPALYFGLFAKSAAPSPMFGKSPPPPSGYQVPPPPPPSPEVGPPYAARYAPPYTS